jgi:hypothetical protein
VRPLSLSLTKNGQITDLPKVLAFLSSILRNSRKSKYTYQHGLIHFQKFIVKTYPNYNIETILGPLSRNEINLYEMLEGFVSYMTSTNPDLTPNSMKVYVASIRSYLAYYDIDVIPSKFKRKVRMPKVYREDEEPLDASDGLPLIASLYPSAFSSLCPCCKVPLPPSLLPLPPLPEQLLNPVL